MSGIPDPGGASKAVGLVVDGTSPFDAGRIACPQGGEDRWSARWLMVQLGYDTWENFASVIERAKTAAHNQGYSPQILFRAVTKKTGGRPQSDFEVTRFAAYLIAMNGSSSKPQISAAQEYFAVKTRQAETAGGLSDDELIHRALTISTQRVERLKAQVRELAVPAAAWNELVEAAGDYSVADAAKVLSRDSRIDIGQNRLFTFMAKQDWIYRREHRWRAYQSQVDNGRLTEKVGKPFVRDGVMCNGEPTVRITPKGLAELHKRLGGSGQLELVAVV